MNRLLKLRAQLSRDVPAKDADDHVLIATWNIRDFGKDEKQRKGFGPRLPETHFYIAEIISRFDFVAVQEVNQLTEWERVIDILGPDWNYIATDVADAMLGGNGERLTYVYDRRKVRFQNIAGEVVLPPSMLISKATVKFEKKKAVSGAQFRRTPFVASFQAGWFKFDICTVHIYYGSESGNELEERIEEIDRVAEYLSKRADIRMQSENRSLILLGDFNIVSPEHKTMGALLRHGFHVPETLRNKTNIGGTKYYDQIAFKIERGVLDYVDNVVENPRDRFAGVFRFFESVLVEEDEAHYVEAMNASSACRGKKYRKNQNPSGHIDYPKYYKDWRTYQLSDHCPLWVRLKVNGADDYLRKMRST
ncbi:MAG: endonuclease/exonuclease/phosphatase family protein [Candidatus Hydrogenedentes bacterium]|nr:endonuclease/exonuclease/phosphatase family protein [Candidatus Hydrogenedentota bacterium]